MTTEVMTEEETETETEVAEESIELTARELAILNDEDPDSIETEVEGEVVEEVEVEVETEVEVEEEQPASVHSEESVAKAKSLGLSDEDLTDFVSERSLQRYLDLLEEKNGLTATKEPETEVVADSVVEVPAVEGLLDLSEYESEGWDEKSLAIPKALRQEQEHRAKLQAEVETFRAEIQRLTEVENRRQHETAISKFHEAVDSLDDVELLGRTRDETGRSVKLTDAQEKNRTKLFAQVDTIAAVMAEDAKKAGKTVNATWDEVVEKAKVIAFGVTKAPAKPDKAEALKNQSARRRPVAKSAVSSPTRVADDDSAEAIANRPEVVAFWNRLQQE